MEMSEPTEDVEEGASQSEMGEYADANDQSIPEGSDQQAEPGADVSQDDGQEDVEPDLPEGESADGSE